MSKDVTHRFSATLNRPQGARVFKGTMNGCPGMSEAILVCRELLLQNDAFEDDVTSIKITISPKRRKQNAIAVAPPTQDSNEAIK